MAKNNTLLVEYDLSKPGQDYPGLIDFLKNTGSWAHHLKSAWLVRSSLTAAQMRDKVMTYLDSNDKVIVMDVSGDSAAWHGLPQDVGSWIKNNL